MGSKNMSKAQMLSLVTRVIGYSLMNRPRKSLFVLEKLRDVPLIHQSVFFWFMRGTNLNDLKEYDAAVTAFAVGYRINPKHLALLKRYGNALNKSGKYKEAVTIYSQLLESLPKDAFTWNMQALTLKDLARYEEALVSVDNALALRPRNVHILCTKGEIYLAMGDFKESLKWIRQAIDKGYKPAWKYAAASLSGLGREEEAQQAEEKASRTKPQSR